MTIKELEDSLVDALDELDAIKPIKRGPGGDQRSIKIDDKIVFGMAKIGCNQSEIARVLGVDPSLISRRYKELVQEGYANLDASLRRVQIRLALGGNPTMCIWMGKQLLGQVDKTESKVEITKIEQLKEALDEVGTVISNEEFEERRNKLKIVDG